MSVYVIRNRMAVKIPHFYLLNFYCRFENLDEVLRILKEIVSLSTTRKEIDRIEKFAEENKLENMNAALNDAKLHLQWSERNVPIIKNAIKQIHH